MKHSKTPERYEEYPKEAESKALKTLKEAKNKNFTALQLILLQEKSVGVKKFTAQAADYI